MSQLFLPAWLVERMIEDDRRFAESLVIGPGEWIEHPAGTWEVRTSDES